MARVSIITPTYNRSEMLGQALRSVQEQTFDDFELLVIDDGSTDDTEALVRDFDDSRIKYNYQQHIGVPAASRNRAIQQASGEYLAFLDSDDFWLPHKLAAQVAHMDEHPDDALIYGDALIFRDDPAAPLPYTFLYRKQGLSGFAFDQLYGNSHIPNSTVMIRASVIPQVGLLNEDVRLKANEDYEYWLRIAHRYPLRFMNEPFACYRQHHHGISKESVAHFQAKLFLVGLLDVMYPETKMKLSPKRSAWLSRIHAGLAYHLLRQGMLGSGAHHLVLGFRQSPMTFLHEVVAMPTRWLGRSFWEFQRQ